MVAIDFRSHSDQGAMPSHHHSTGIRFERSVPRSLDGYDANRRSLTRQRLWLDPSLLGFLIASWKPPYDRDDLRQVWTDINVTEAMLAE